MSLIHPKDIMETSHIVDVRNPDEFSQEHIPGSRNIPLAQIGTYAKQLHHASVILTCRSGRRAAEAKAFLEAQGCTDLSLLAGGLQGWKAAGYPSQSFKKGYSLTQQVQMITGSMILVGAFVKPLWFLAPLAGIGLLTAGLTNTCLMAAILSKMPWNRLPGNGVGACATKTGVADHCSTGDSEGEKA